MKNTQIITFENSLLGEVRGFVDEHGELWFLAGQVCRCLKLSNASESLRKIKEKHNRFGEKIDGITIREVVITDSLGRKNRSKIINENILYELIFQSQTEKAFYFQQWVFKEILPSLRKHGEYRMEGKLIRRTLTDTIKDSGENERMHGFGYPTYTILINQSLGLPNKVDRNSLTSEMLAKIAKREDLVRSLVAEGKQYSEIKTILERNFVA